MRTPFTRPICLGLLLSLVLPGLVLPGLADRAGAEEYLSGIQWQKPAKVTPGEQDSAPPSDAMVLFDGTNLDAWKGGEQWEIENGVAIAQKGGIQTKQKFGDCQLHLEWSSPKPPKGQGQGRGNSGVLFYGRYEVQILDSFGNSTYPDGQAGAIYKQTPPRVNAMRPPGEWNSYDIMWTAPKFNDQDKLDSPAYVTVLHNGVLIVNHFQLLGNTDYHQPPHYEAHSSEGSISLQHHGNPVRFRNIWVRKLPPAQGKQVRPPFIRNGNKETPIKPQQ